jgi:hypothetical protein
VYFRLVLEAIALANDPRLESRHLAIAIDHEAITISYEAPWSITLGLLTRAERARHEMNSELQRMQPLERGDDGKTIVGRFVLKDIKQVRRIGLRIDKKLDALARERLPFKMMEVILGITSSERTRWNKDGRLPRSGTGTFKKGRQIIQFAMHPIDKIAELARNPAVISAWRAAMPKQKIAASKWPILTSEHKFVLD